MQVGIDTGESWGDATGDDYRVASAVEGFLRPLRLACGGGSSGEICKPNTEQEAQLWAARVFNVLAAEKSLPDLVRQQKS
jgi:hypothetical protein